MEKSLTFEQALVRLEEIVKQLEQGRVSLDESLRLFEEGTALAAACNQQLETAELRVVRLMKGADGNPVEMEFEEHDA